MLQHVLFAAVHRDDSDDDEPIAGPRFRDAWEARLYREAYDSPYRSASDDESYRESDEYWDEDDGSDFEDERQSYGGFVLRQVAPNPMPQYTRSRYGSGDSNVSAGLDSNVATGSVSDDFVFDDEPVPLIPTTFPPTQVAGTRFEGVGVLRPVGPSPRVSRESSPRSSRDFSPRGSQGFSPRGSRELAPNETYVPVPPIRPSALIFNCPLCFEAPFETSATRCGHVFCTS